MKKIVLSLLVLVLIFATCLSVFAEVNPTDEASGRPAIPDNLKAKMSLLKDKCEEGRAVRINLGELRQAAIEKNMEVREGFKNRRAEELGKFNELCEQRKGEKEQLRQSFGGLNQQFKGAIGNKDREKAVEIKESIMQSRQAFREKMVEYNAKLEESRASMQALRMEMQGLMEELAPYKEALASIREEMKSSCEVMQGYRQELREAIQSGDFDGADVIVDNMISAITARTEMLKGLVDELN